MDQITPTTFWSTTTIIASAIGATLFLSVSHSGEPKHPESASENEVNQIEVKLERVATDVEYNKILLGDLSKLNLCKVHLLLLHKIQKKIERPLE